MLDMANHSSSQVKTRQKAIKRSTVENAQSDLPRKRLRLLSDDEDFSDQEQDATNGSDEARTTKHDLPSNELGITINKEFARRFEHNKQREELHKRKSMFNAL